MELKNYGQHPLNLAGFKFTRGIEFTFQAGDRVTQLAPGARVMIVKNTAAFASRYPGALEWVGGRYTGSLDNGGERLTLEGPLERADPGF